MQIQKFIQNYRKDTGGNMAAIFAVTVTALLLGVGVAVDTSLAHKTRTKLQNAADAAVLAAAKSGETTQVKLEEIAKDAVNANNSAGQPMTTSLALTANGRVRVNINSAYKTQLMGMFGKGNMDLAVVSEAPLAASEPVNLALVLDTTGSMSGAKMAGLKTAANNLITTLEGYKNPTLKVSVVPFSQYVNVGLSRRNAPWLDVPADSTTTGAQVCRMRRDVTSTSNCRMETRTCYNDGVAYSCQRRVCDYTYGPPYNSCYTPTITQTWRGCVGSRTGGLDENVAYAGSKIPGLMNTNCGTEILPLTNTMASVKSKIRALNASGNTYIPAGLAWGWRTLDTNEPLTEASGPFANNTQKVMVLMTDGANTKSKSGIRHNGSSAANANAKTKTMCNNIKASGIQIYTIAYDITDTATKNLMKNCATTNAMYYDASNAAKLNDAFQSIAASLIKLRLTH